MKHYNRQIGITDMFIQGFMFCTIVNCWIMGIVQGSGGFWIYAMIFQFCFGAYQMGSACMGMIMGRKWKRKYFFSAIVYMIIAAGINICIGDARWYSSFYFSMVIAMWMIIPMIMGGYYFFRNTREVIKGGEIEIAVS